MEIPKKIFILDTAAEDVWKLREDLGARYPSCRFDHDTVPDRGLIKIVDWHPDLLIAAADLGAVSGFDMSRVLKMIPAFSDMPVVLMRQAGDSSHSPAKMDGADLYVPKGDGLIESVQEALERLLFDKEPAPAPEKRPVQRVLVVDDSRTMRRIITMILVGIGIPDVVEAGDGVQAIKKLITEKPHLIFVDYSMPRMNGLVFVQEVRKMIEMKSVPIVVVSAELPDEIEEVLRAGANDYLSKPFTMKNVYDIVAHFASNMKAPSVPPRSSSDNEKADASAQEPAAGN